MNSFFSDGNPDLIKVISHPWYTRAANLKYLQPQEDNSIKSVLRRSNNFQICSNKLHKTGLVKI